MTDDWESTHTKIKYDSEQLLMLFVHANLKLSWEKNEKITSHT